MHRQPHPHHPHPTHTISKPTRTNSSPSSAPSLSHTHHTNQPHPTASCCPAGDALKGLGLPEFPDGAGLGLHISGSPDHPRVEVARCVCMAVTAGGPARMLAGAQAVVRQAGSAAVITPQPPAPLVDAPAPARMPCPNPGTVGGRPHPGCRASRDLALLLASQQASSLVKSKGGPQWLADKLEGLGAGAQARGVQMPPPLT